MSDEKHDPWALLREARESVFRDSLCREYDDTHKTAAMEEHKRRTRLAALIDAALAAREAEELVEDVKWRQEADYDGSVVYVARLKSKSLRVFYRYDKTFDWTASVVWSKEGKSRTLDEAQRAALAAARGTR